MVLSMDRWRGKVAIVTGASSGIGAAIVMRLVEDGMVVVGLARRLDRMKDLEQQLHTSKGKFHPYQCDMSVESDILSSFKYVTENIGPVHVLINNAGCSFKSTLAEGDTEKWKTTIDVNVLGLCIATREAVKDMKKNHIDGHIIHINSILGHRLPVLEGLNIYPATKHAVTALTETLRQEINKMKLKIRITSISPGIVTTDFFTSGNHQSIKKQVEDNDMPFLSPEDIADGVHYTLSTPAGVNVLELTIKPVNELL
nr:farnesol dehydrogenase-like [Leptinotarsa decemlineata]XP_023021488.1 farnesol dehydrogenase-like [Leptinotarsa decemlineata]